MVSASGIGNQSHHKSDQKQAAATVLADRPAAGVAPGVPNGITPAALEEAKTARRQKQVPVAAVGGASPPVPASSPPAAPPGSLAGPNVASTGADARGVFAPATTDPETDVSASTGAWLSGPMVSFLILGGLIFKCFWTEGTEETSTHARRASLDAAAAAFTQRRPSAFAHKNSSGDMHASRSSSRKYRRTSNDAPAENESMARSGSHGPADHDADAPRMKRHSSYKDRRSASSRHHSGESEASHAEGHSSNSMARSTSYRVRREASRSREVRHEPSHSREPSASRGHAHSRERSASGGQAQPVEPSASYGQEQPVKPSASLGQADSNEEF